MWEITVATDCAELMLIFQRIAVARLRHCVISRVAAWATWYLALHCAFQKFGRWKISSARADTTGRQAGLSLGNMATLPRSLMRQNRRALTTMTTQHCIRPG